MEKLDWEWVFAGLRTGSNGAGSKKDFLNSHGGDSDEIDHCFRGHVDHPFRGHADQDRSEATLAFVILEK